MRRSLVLTLAMLSGCSSGGGDLNRLEERPKPLGNPIAEKAAPEQRLPDGQTLHARGVVVIAVDMYDDSRDGRGVGDVYVQDPVQTGPKGTPWSGLRLYRPTKNPPDLVLAPGHGVDLVGEFQAFAGPPGSSPFGEGIFVPQVSGAALTLTSESRAPEPVDITPEDLADPVTGMQYASRLVRMRNVTIVTDFGGSRPEARIFDNSGAIRLAAKLFPIHLNEQIGAKKGVTLKSVTGVLDYFYNFKLCPRSVADVEP